MAVRVQDILTELQGTKFPASITLLSLATHTSGLPRVPENMMPLVSKHPLNPYAYYTHQDLLEYLGNYSSPPPPPGPAAFEYSNLGAGLLGYRSLISFWLRPSLHVRARCTCHYRVSVPSQQRKIPIANFS